MAASTRGSPVGARAGRTRSESISYFLPPAVPLATWLLAGYATLPRERYRPTRSEAHMTTAEECRTALQKLSGRLSELSPAERDQYFGNRTISVTIPDLNVTFVSVLGSGDDPVREAAPGESPADIRMTAKSDESLLAVI